MTPIDPDADLAAALGDVPTPDWREIVKAAGLEPEAVRRDMAEHFFPGEAGKYDRIVASGLARGDDEFVIRACADIFHGAAFRAADAVLTALAPVFKALVAAERERCIEAVRSIAAPHHGYARDAKHSRRDRSEAAEYARSIDKIADRLAAIRAEPSHG